MPGLFARNEPVDRTPARAYGALTGWPVGSSACRERSGEVCTGFAWPSPSGSSGSSVSSPSWPGPGATTRTAAPRAGDHDHHDGPDHLHHPGVDDHDHRADHDDPLRRGPEGRGGGDPPGPLVRLVRRHLPEGPRRPLEGGGDERQVTRKVSPRWRSPTFGEPTPRVSGRGARDPARPRGLPGGPSPGLGRHSPPRDRPRPSTCSGRTSATAGAGRPRLGHPNDLWLGDCDDLVREETP
jgi:hypothetical protein